MRRKIATWTITIPKDCVNWKKKRVRECICFFISSPISLIEINLNDYDLLRYYVSNG